MDIDDRHIWDVWAAFLQRWGLDEWAAMFLEGAGPLTILGAQVVAIARPLLAPSKTGEHLAALSRMLDAPDATRAFVTYLREADLQ